MHNLTLTKVVKADPGTVFDAFITKEKIEQWIAPGAMKAEATTFEPKSGGNFEIAMTNAEGKTFVVGGVFKEIETPEKVVMSWRWLSPEPGNETQVTFLFNEVPDGTEVVLKHENFREETHMKHHEEGWTGSLINLEAMFA